MPLILRLQFLMSFPRKRKLKFLRQKVVPRKKVQSYIEGRSSVGAAQGLSWTQNTKILPRHHGPSIVGAQEGAKRVQMAQLIPLPKLLGNERRMK